MSAEIGKTFCIFPFVQTVVRTNGSMGPCCHIQTLHNIQRVDIEKFWQSNELKDLRKFMLDNQEIPYCNTCYQEEKQTGNSMRTKSLNDYRLYNKKHLDYYTNKVSLYPERLEIHLGNLCNLKCLTCNPRDSSSFLSENLSLGLSNLNQKDCQLDEQLINQLTKSAIDHRIKILDLRGGESMLLPSIKKILLEWPQEQANDMTIRIQTNCTIMNDEWIQIFKKFKKLDIMMSIDAYEKDNEYIRFPANWNDIEKNVEIITGLTNAKTYINCTVSNLNFLLLPQLIKWAKQKNIHINWGILTTPTYFKFTNLPLPLYQQGIEQLAMHEEMSWIGTYLHDDILWTDFCNMISKRDNYRKNSIFNILPEFKLYWKTS